MTNSTRQKAYIGILKWLYYLIKRRPFSQDMKWGYLFASGLAGTTLIAALCNAHFNLFMSELGLKVRAAVTAAVYRHTVRLTAAQMGRFGVGEVINFMSTDTDRIVNFSPTLQATWSLPLQELMAYFHSFLVGKILIRDTLE